MNNKAARWYFRLIAGFLFFHALACLVAVMADSPGLALSDPFSGISVRTLLWATALIQLLLSLFLLTNGDRRKKSALAAFAGLSFLAYRVALGLDHDPDFLHCLGNFSSTLPFSARFLDYFCQSFLALMVIGSGRLLYEDWEKRQRYEAAEVDALLAEERLGPRRSSLQLLCIWAVTGLLFFTWIGMAKRKASAALPPDLDRILQEAYSVAGFRGAPVGNYANTRLIYPQNKERGIEIRLLDLQTLKSTLLDQTERAEEDSPKAYDLYGWSPDDNYLAYMIARSNDASGRTLVIADGKTGAISKSYNIPGIVQAGTWLNTNTLVIMDKDWHCDLVNLNPCTDRKTYAQQGVVPFISLHGPTAVMPYIAVMSGEAFAINSELYFNVVHLTAPNQSFDYINMDPTAGIEWLDYHQKFNGAFLYCQSHPDTDEPRRLYAQEWHGPQLPTILQLTTNHTFKGSWILDGQGIAYVGTEGNQNYLAVTSTNLPALATNLFTRGHIRSYNPSPDRNRLYALASIGDEPLGLWEYDIRGKALRRLLEAVTRPLTAARIIVPAEKMATNADNETVPYFCLAPPEIAPGKRYPAIIERPGDSRYEPGEQVVANAGIFYVSINRSGLASSDYLGTFVLDAQAVCHELLRDPHIDPKRIYLAGRSASTEGVCDLAELKPELWRGLILQSPLRFPKFTAESHYSVFVSVGDGDKFMPGKKLLKLWPAACTYNVPIDVVVHAHAGHWFEGSDAMKERYRAMVTFVLSGR